MTLPLLLSAEELSEANEIAVKVSINSIHYRYHLTNMPIRNHGYQAGLTIPLCRPWRSRRPDDTAVRAFGRGMGGDREYCSIPGIEVDDAIEIAEKIDI